MTVVDYASRAVPNAARTRMNHPWQQTHSALVSFGAGANTRSRHIPGLRTLSVLHQLLKTVRPEPLRQPVKTSVQRYLAAAVVDAARGG